MPRQPVRRKRTKRSVKAFRVYLLAHGGKCVLQSSASQRIFSTFMILWYEWETVCPNTGKFVQMTMWVISEWTERVYQHLWTVGLAKWLRDAMETLNVPGSAVSWRKLNSSASMWGIGHLCAGRDWKQKPSQPPSFAWSPYNCSHINQLLLNVDFFLKQH